MLEYLGERYRPGSLRCLDQDPGCRTVLGGVEGVRVLGLYEMDASPAVSVAAMRIHLERLLWGGGGGRGQVADARPAASRWVVPGRGTDLVTFLVQTECDWYMARPICVFGFG